MAKLKNAPVMLVIMDGWGNGDAAATDNAVAVGKIRFDPVFSADRPDRRVSERRFCKQKQVLRRCILPLRIVAVGILKTAAAHAELRRRLIHQGNEAPHGGLL